MYISIAEIDILAKMWIMSQKPKNLRLVIEAEVCIKNDSKTMMINVVGLKSNNLLEPSVA